MTVNHIATLVLTTCALIACAQRGPSVAPSTGNAKPPVASAPSPGDEEWLRMFARGYFPGRSGEIFVVPYEGDFLVDKRPLYSFMHGSPWPYDTAIPLLLHGRTFIKTGEFSQPTAQVDVAPTFAALLRATPPATTSGRVLTEAVTSTTARPRVAALFVLDSMRADYFDSAASLLPTLTRLRKEGAWFTNMRARSIPTATAIGHATLGTGTDPRVHGLVVNFLFNRITGKSQEAYDGLDPTELLALTLADVWNLTTDGRAIIIGQGGTTRATAGLVGHGGCVLNGRKVFAASYSTRTSGWETNERCYSVPKPLQSLTAAPVWKAANGTWMGHDISTGELFRASALFQRFEGDALAAVLESEALGQDDITDLVLVNVKSPDYVSHAYGPASAEMRETLQELDRQLARVLAILERKAGADGLLLAITADHGMPNEPRAPRRRIAVQEVVSALDAQFARGGASVVHYLGDPANMQIHMNMTRLRELGVSLQEVATFLRGKFFQAVFTEDEVRATVARLPLGK